MHEPVDTEDQDAAAERYWPEDYKGLIRERLGPALSKQFIEQDAFKAIYEKHYTDGFEDYDQFVSRLEDMVTIGAENGIDEILNEIHTSFHEDTSLPDSRLPARIHWPELMDEDLKEELHQRVFHEFRDHHAYEHIFEDHHHGEGDFDDFMHEIADMVVAGAVKGVDKTLDNIYRSFLTGKPLPPARRYPKRLI